MFFQEIAAGGITFVEQRQREVRFQELAEHDDADLGCELSEFVSQPDALVRVCRWHPDVGDHNVARRPPEVIEHTGRVLEPADDVVAGFGRQQRRDAFTNEEIVFRHHHLGHGASIPDGVFLRVRRWRSADVGQLLYVWSLPPSAARRASRGDSSQWRPPSDSP